eukprot:TRINITY_DN20490_c0_g1_i1.p1 TRINITY_DN20490_c0_g1~~TRINITY_DN20490_c0_g1_i1.p1  ORF type:complete len:293 (-),score=80.90 TRINITY_DN20490_c0_g1_i1:4-882(-)
MGKSIRMSVAALLNFEGAEDEYRLVIDLAKKARRQYEDQQQLEKLTSTQPWSAAGVPVSWASLQQSTDDVVGTFVLTPDAGPRPLGLASSDVSVAPSPRRRGLRPSGSSGIDGRSLSESDPIQNPARSLSESDPISDFGPRSASVSTVGSRSARAASPPPPVEVPAVASAAASAAMMFDDADASADEPQPASAPTPTTRNLTPAGVVTTRFPHSAGRSADSPPLSTVAYSSPPSAAPPPSAVAPRTATPRSPDPPTAPVPTVPSAGRCGAPPPSPRVAPPGDAPPPASVAPP